MHEQQEKCKNADDVVKNKRQVQSSYKKNYYQFVFGKYLRFGYTSTDSSNYESNNLFLYAFVPSPSLPSPDRLQEEFKKATTRFFGFPHHWPNFQLPKCHEEK